MINEETQNDGETPTDCMGTSAEKSLPNIAESIENPSAENVPREDDVDEEHVGKEDYDALYKECIRVQVENTRCAWKINQINQVIKRIQKERKFLMKKLEEFGDDYHAEKLKVVEEEERRIEETLYEDQGPTTSESKKPKKKIKVKRLQNAPKKPTNAFLMFCQKNRDLVQERYNKIEISRQEMTRKLAEIWQQTPQEDRKAYYEMYEKDKARYAQEMKDFESKSANLSAPLNETPSTSADQQLPSDFVQSSGS